ncbi:subtilisin-like protein [Myriangium duriaei CBS 260.36]|uniref:Subtilisin-like protein n=1 Tax=Myriangium duriaei CBS 260.36 TaxID=1168546 RepID=A0A9P4IUP0_9PEZI|nr:subtilisin-like protein [Myriangium duriaei CBS 260.36]
MKEFGRTESRHTDSCSISVEEEIVTCLQAESYRLQPQQNYYSLGSQNDTEVVDSRFSSIQSRLPSPTLITLEKRLRESLKTINIDNLSTNDVDAESLIAARNHLKSWCLILEQLVNHEFVSGITSPCLTRAKSPYSSLLALVDALKQDRRNFNLFNRGFKDENNEVTLFYTTSRSLAEQASTIVIDFNRVFKSLDKPPLKDLLPQEDLGVDEDIVAHAQELHNRFKRPFERLLSILNDEYTCGDTGHLALLQVSGFDNKDAASLDLFLSTCSHSKEWLEVHLEPEPSGEDTDWQKNEDLCTAIGQLDPTMDTLFLSLRHEKIHTFNHFSSRLREAQYLDQKPSTSLNDLLHDHAFVESTEWFPRKTKTHFSPKEKRILAENLVLGFGYQWDPGHTLKSWDAHQVYFPTGSNGHCNHHHAFALCVPPNAHDDQSAPSKSKLSNAESLARLLMHIEYGLLPSIDSPGELRKHIVAGLSRKSQRYYYLMAVKECLDFQRRCDSLAQKMNGSSGDYAAVARLVTALKLAERVRNASLPPRHPGEFKAYSVISAPSVICYPPHVSQKPLIETRSSSAWFRDLSRFSYALEMADSDLMAGSVHRVRIAILDTGLEARYDHEVPLERYHDFVDSGQQIHQDLSGHGTDMYRIIRKVFKNAEYYVGRVFESNDLDNRTADLMATAIGHAVATWKVDIIAIPSGFKTEHDGILYEIIKASLNNVLVFAAPANWGNAAEVAFPGRLYKSYNVISMFSTNANNKPTCPFNPAPKQGFPFNLAILGEDVIIPPRRDPMEGTSVSTMIGVGVAARILAFASHPSNAARIPNAIKLKRIHGMSNIFKAMSVQEGGYDCVLLDRLLPEDPNCSDEEVLDHVCSEIRTKLNRLYN